MAGEHGPDDVLKGIGLSALGYALFAIQDATVKWLVVDLPVSEILLVRSLGIMAVAGVIGRGAAFRDAAASRSKRALALRAALILAAWLSYYTATAHLELAQITTIYFAAPIVAVVLAALILKERVVVARWLAVLGGFAGVLLAAGPARGGQALYIGLALIAACCWGLSVVLVRLIARSETTAAQMVVTNALFALACLPLVVVGGHVPGAFDLALMLGLGLVGGLGQWVLYEGFRFAPASAVAPVEYTGLVWAFLYGYLIWGEVPSGRVDAGAATIVVASLLLIVSERRRAERSGADQGGHDLPVPDEADRGAVLIDDEKRA